MKKVALILSFIGSLLSFVAIIVLILEKTHVITEQLCIDIYSVFLAYYLVFLFVLVWNRKEIFSKGHNTDGYRSQN